MTRLKVALVGCGKVAVKHLKAILSFSRDIELVGLADINPEAPGALCRACGLPPVKAAAVPVYADYHKMLDDQAPDLVAVTTASGSHYEIAAAAIAAGAHVLVEKPLTLSLREADQLLEAARSRKVLIAVGHIYRFFPMVRMLQEDLRKGLFGRVLYGQVDVFWGHDQAYYDQAAWRGTWSQDGGALMNQSIHALDLMTWLLGSPVREVIGRIGRLSHVMEAEDIGLAVLRMENGGFCQVAGTTCTKPERHEASFIIVGTDGEVRCGLDRGKPRVKIIGPQGKKLTMRYLCRYLREQLKEGGLRSLIRLSNPHCGLYGDLLQAVRENRNPLADGLSGRQGVELVLAIYRSSLENRPVTLPLADFSIAAMTGFFDS
jgi:UDP-N-acetyl-2-amino-2-deoxyglucuronate dehydrogenase